MTTNIQYYLSVGQWNYIWNVLLPEQEWRVSSDYDSDNDAQEYQHRLMLWQRYFKQYHLIYSETHDYGNIPGFYGIISGDKKYFEWFLLAMTEFISLE